MPATTDEIRVGAFEAKARLSELLRLVRAGAEVTITHRGRPVARLVPYRDRDRRAAEAAVEALARMPRVRDVSAEEVREWIEAGRS